MKLLCDVCENAVACVVCCADEAALCSSCDSRVHAANKLASKHLRVPLVSDTSEPAICDICQERPSFFFCVEDRALLCRECDVSVHSANALAAKHRRLLLTGIKVGPSPTGSSSQETSSAITLEQHMLATSPVENIGFALKKPVIQDMAVAVENHSKDDGGIGRRGNGNKLPSSPQKVSSKASPALAPIDAKSLRSHTMTKLPSSPRKVSSKASPAPAPIDAKSLRSYAMTKEGTLCMASNINININTDHRKTATADMKRNSTTISIQRISAGQRAPFVAPVLSSIRSSLLREDAYNNDYSKDANNSNSGHSNIDEYSNNDSVMRDVDASSPVGNNSVSDYLNSGVPGWRLDELLTDLVGACDSGRSLSPLKESNVPGFALQEEHSWFSELDFLAEHELSPSQEESVALVPEMPSPPTHSGLVTSRGKPTYPAVQPWAFDYLFTGPDHFDNEFSVVPDIGGRRSFPVSPSSPPRGNVNKKRKY